MSGHVSFVWSVPFFFARIRSCIAKCCWALVQDRCDIDVAYFCCAIKCVFDDLLWNFLFCFFCYFCFVVFLRLGSAVLFPFYADCVLFSLVLRVIRFD